MSLFKSLLLICLTCYSIGNVKTSLAQTTINSYGMDFSNSSLPESEPYFPDLHKSFEIEKDSTKQKRKDKNTSGGKRKHRNDAGLQAHIMITIVFGVIFIPLFIYYRNSVAQPGCMGAFFRSILLIFVIFFGYGFALIFLTLVVHLVSRLIQKKNRTL